MASHPLALTPCTSAADAVEKAEGTEPGRLMSGANTTPEGCADGGSKGSAGVRIQPMDSKIRLQLMKTQVCMYACVDFVSKASH